VSTTCWKTDKDKEQASDKKGNSNGLIYTGKKENHKIK
jgi:hypothetical protein